MMYTCSSLPKKIWSRSVLTVLLAALGFSCGHSPHSNVNEHRAFTMSVGGGGGVTGGGGSYELTSEGIVRERIRTTALGPVVTHEYSASRDSIMTFKGLLDSSGIFRITARGHGNMTWSIGFETAGMSYSWTWESMELAPPKVREWYETVGRYCRSIIETK